MSEMKIVVLDDAPLVQNDLDWRLLAGLGELTSWPRSRPEEVVSRAAGAQIVLTNKTLLDQETIRALPHLRYIGVLATGVNVVDLDAARKQGIVVTNVPGYSTMSVAQLTWALILELANRTGLHGAATQRGDWSNFSDFSMPLTPQLELAGKRLGLVGFGAIGRAVATIGQAFGMEVAVATPRPERAVAAGFCALELDELLRTSDVVSLHCPLSDATRHLLDADRLALMQPHALLINTGRGPLVDEIALAAALHASRLGGAGLDVLSVEPPPHDHPLLAAPNCIVTPHIAWATRAARERMLAIVAANLCAWQAGQPINRVA